MNPGSIGLCLVMQTHPFMHALYAVPVRQAGTCSPSLYPSPDIRLPSDSASRRTPLPSPNAPYCQARSGLPPPSYCPCRTHKKIALENAVFSRAFGGLYWTRTSDPIDVNDVLYQLSQQTMGYSIQFYLANLVSMSYQLSHATLFNYISAAQSPLERCSLYHCAPVLSSEKCA